MKKEYRQFLLQEFNEQLNFRFPFFERTPEIDGIETYSTYTWHHGLRSNSYVCLVSHPNLNEFYIELAYSNKGQFPENADIAFDLDENVVQGEFRISLEHMINCDGWKIGRRYRGREKVPFPKQEGRPAGWMKKVEEENIKFAVTDAVNMIEKHAIPLFKELVRNYP